MSLGMQNFFFDDLILSLNKPYCNHFLLLLLSFFFDFKALIASCVAASIHSFQVLLREHQWNLLASHLPFELSFFGVLSYSEALFEALFQALLEALLKALL
jgi:hypothetical protein